jgi:putative ABC transport system permease protein
VTRWAWRLFRREWRQQFLVLALIVVAVAALIVGASVSTNSPAPADAGFGTAQYAATLEGTPAHVLSQTATLEHVIGQLDIIENQSVAVPGTITAFDIRSQNPLGPYGRPTLSLVSGHYPTGADQVAVTAGVASDFHLHVGGTWEEDGHDWQVVGTVQNPLSLLDQFALVAPGQLPLTSATSATVLFDASKSTLRSLPSAIQFQSVTSATNGNVLNPATITLALATLGMLLIGLVSIAGFTVLAQRRLRSIGMLESLGATDGNVRLVVRANGAVVGLVGAFLGAVVGFGLWLAYRPHLEQSSHHLIGMFALPWTVVIVALVLAVVTPYVAATRPARTITRIPIVAALSGRPAPPKQVGRSAAPGVVALVLAVVLMGLAGSNSSGGGDPLPLVGGLVALIIGVVLLAPTFITALAAVGRRAPLSIRLALRDLARYRARSSAALGAVSVGVLVAVVICVAASARYADVLDYAGPNLASNQVVVYAAQNPPPGSVLQGPNGQSQIVSSSSLPTVPSMKTQTADAEAIARSLDSHGMIPLVSANASISRTTQGSNNFSGQVYVATPALLRAFGISTSEINPLADFLSSRPGLAGQSNLEMTFGGKGQNVGPSSGGPVVPVIEDMPQLPLGTSAPNTLLTEQAIAKYHLGSGGVNGWLLSTSGPLTATQISETRAAAAADGLTIETKNDEPSSYQVIDWATAAGLALALAVLAMTVGLIRSETASDLRTLAATGASSRKRRAITAATAGALAFLGAVLGTGAGYLATAGYFRTGQFGESLLDNIGQVPAINLLIILVGMPVVAIVAGWLLAGREPKLVSRQPME